MCVGDVLRPEFIAAFETYDRSMLAYLRMPSVRTLQLSRENQLFK